MKYLVVGLGSMGKRRIRCLKKLGVTSISGFDIREDRRNEVGNIFKINIFNDFKIAIEEKPDVLIISVPPGVHHIYMKEAVLNNIHFFVEASVLDTEMSNIISSLEGNSIIAVPSSTLLFHPAIKTISDILKNNTLGKISNIILHSGQYLPDWHSYEDVSDYYVSNKETGGAREIVPFELTWLTSIFGFPKKVVGNHRKTINIEGAPLIDDTYNILLDYESFLASITIDVVSRHATRRLLINGQNGQLIWDWDFKETRWYSGDQKEWLNIPYNAGNAEEGYNPNIGEDMYVHEVENFISAVMGKEQAKNNLQRDYKVLKLLYAIEESDENSCVVSVDL